MVWGVGGPEKRVGLRRGGHSHVVVVLLKVLVVAALVTTLAHIVIKPLLDSYDGPFGGVAVELSAVMTPSSSGP